MQSREVTVQTGGRRGLYDLTDACARFLDGVAPDQDGLLHVFVPHATAGVVVMELGAGSEPDLMEALRASVEAFSSWYRTMRWIARMRSLMG